MPAPAVLLCGAQMSGVSPTEPALDREEVSIRPDDERRGLPFDALLEPARSHVEDERGTACVTDDCAAARAVESEELDRVLALWLEPTQRLAALEVDERRAILSTVSRHERMAAVVTPCEARDVTRDLGHDTHALEPFEVPEEELLATIAVTLVRAGCSRQRTPAVTIDGGYEEAPVGLLDACLRTSAAVPFAERAVVTPLDRDLLVGDADEPASARLRVDRAQERAGLHVPHLHGGVRRGGDEKALGRREGHVLDHIRVSEDRSDLDTPHRGGESGR